ncbi:hypothetical protein AB870_02590 [Pandoraea faecigallinarum]|uniref:Uncharacterized protein n=1 Tax=Pandoraea faecigallinarum TaxID=656179 RepID=A0A0H3WNG0_9BURK|nr:hypothetical protein [Pandoraea faecigallinarum]AKM29252.1 hypothetical protein AB870_02590 [Pandoraea faecigallinarum]
MTTSIFVAFTDASETEIDSVFGGPQPVESFPDQGTIPSDDARYISYYNTVTELFPNLVDTLIKPGD